MRGKWKWIFIVPAAIAGMVLFVAIGGEVVKQLWNWLLPPIFGFREITFWQGLGMLALCRILFGGFGFGGSHRRHTTREERERFRQWKGQRWGRGPSTDESGGQPI